MCIQWLEELQKLCSCWTFYYLGITITSIPKQQQQKKTTALSSTSSSTTAAATATSTVPTLLTTIYLCHRRLQLLLQVRPPEVLLLLLRPPSPLVRPALLHRVIIELDVRRREDRLQLSPWESGGLGGAAVALLVVAGALAEDLVWGEVGKSKEILKSNLWSKHYKFNRSLPELEVTVIFWRFFFPSLLLEKFHRDFPPLTCLAESSMLWCGSEDLLL